MFDSSYLAVKRAYLSSSPSHHLAFSLPPKRHPNLGSALTIELGKAHDKGDKLELVIEYSTTDECTALGWLDAAQTDSGKFPFVYAQCQVRHRALSLYVCSGAEDSPRRRATVLPKLTLLPSISPSLSRRPQAIHARSLLPCFDTPAIKATYAATVHSTLPILLSALRVSPPLDAPAPPIDGTVYTTTWAQDNAVPSYLIGVVGGELVFRALGERTGVWAQPGVIDAAHWEFKEDTERYVAASLTFYVTVCTLSEARGS